MATSDIELATGAFILFFTNLVGIIISAKLIFLWKSYGSWKKAIWALFFLVISIIVISLPLNLSFQEMIIENRINHAIDEFDRRYSRGIKGFVDSIEVELEGDTVLVLISIIREPLRPDENNPQERLEFVRDFLSEQVGKPIHLKIRVLPVEILDYEVAAPSKDAKQP